MRSVTTSVLLLSAGVGLSGADAAEAAETHRFKLGLSVGRACRATHPGSTAPSGAQTASLGTVRSLCNDNAHFEIYADHPGGASADGVSFNYGGRVVPASASGRTLLASTSTPVHVTRTLSLVADAPIDGAFPVSVSSRVDGAPSSAFSSAAKASARRRATSSVASFDALGSSSARSSVRNATLLTPRSRGVLSSLFGLFGD